jgi:hypothetical protein
MERTKSDLSSTIDTKLYGVGGRQVHSLKLSFIFLGVGRIMLDPITTVETPMRLMCFASWMISDAVCDAKILLADVIHRIYSGATFIYNI